MSPACAALQWTDSLIRCLDSLPGFRDMVLLSLVISPPPPPIEFFLPLSSGRISLLQEQPVLLKGSDGSDGTGLRRPLQSYQFSGVEKVSVDEERVAVVVHRLAGVIR